MIRVFVFSIDFNASRGWQGLVYIVQSINPEPSDQTNLNKQHRCNLGGGGEPTQQRGADRCALEAGRPTGGVGRCLALRFSVVSSRVFQNLLGLFLLWISVIKSDIQVHLDGFLDKPYRKYRFSKTHEICQFKSLDIRWRLYLCPYTCYIDGL